MTVFQGLLAARSGMMLVGVLLSEGGFQPIRSGFATLKLAVSWTQKTSPISFNGRNPLSRSAFKCFGGIENSTDRIRKLEGSKHW